MTEIKATSEGTKQDFLSRIRPVLQDLAAVVPSGSYSEDIETLNRDDFTGYKITLIPRYQKAARIAILYEVRNNELQIVFGDVSLVEIFTDRSTLDSAIEYLSELIVGVMKNGFEETRWIVRGQVAYAKAQLLLGGDKRVSVGTGTLFRLFGWPRRERKEYSPYDATNRE